MLPHQGNRNSVQTTTLSRQGAFLHLVQPDLCCPGNTRLGSDKRQQLLDLAAMPQVTRFSPKVLFRPDLWCVATDGLVRRRKGSAISALSKQISYLELTGDKQRWQKPVSATHSCSSAASGGWESSGGRLVTWAVSPGSYTKCFAKGHNQNRTRAERNITWAAFCFTDADVCSGRVVNVHL